MSFFGVELSSQINRMMFEIRLSLSRNKFYPNFRSIYRAFSEYDPELSGFIHPVHFEKALNTNGIFFKKYEIQLFEKAFCNEQGKINWFTFLSHLKEPMGPIRRQLIEVIFDNIDVQKSGKIAVESLLSRFNPSEIESFKNRKKTKQMVENQLLSMLFIRDGFITKEEFISFYDDLNINFAQNDVFLRFVSTKWSFQTPKIGPITEEQLKLTTKKLRFKILEKLQQNGAEYIKQLFDEFDSNKNGCIGAYQLDLMMKKFDCKSHARFVAPIVEKLDRNKSGYLEFDDFQQFVSKDPYPPI